jgi:hypothetical protein
MGGGERSETDGGRVAIGVLLLGNSFLVLAL